MRRSRAALMAMTATLFCAALLLALPQSKPVLVRTSIIETGDVLQTVLLAGEVSWRQQQACVSLTDGRVSRVFVQSGQPVKAGELLFLMDTSAQEEALSALMQAEHQQRGVVQDEALSALVASAAMQRTQEQTRLLAMVEAAQIRADADGVVGAVYVQEGSAVPGAGVMGWVHGEEMCIMAAALSQDIQGLSAGAAAVITVDGISGAARLVQLSAPAVKAEATQPFQQLTFVPLDEKFLSGCTVGDSVTVELLQNNVSGCAVMPLAAVSASGRVWTVEDGRAFSYETGNAFFGSNGAALSAEWLGRRVILSPDSHALYEGCAVQEADRS